MVKLTCPLSYGSKSFSIIFSAIYKGDTFFVQISQAAEDIKSYTEAHAHNDYLVCQTGPNPWKSEGFCAVM